MGFDPSRVFLTAHWADLIFSDQAHGGNRALPFNSQGPVVLYAGRISREKGVLELPGIMRMIRSVIPGVQLVVAGTGPAEDELKKLLPEACYLGWVDRESLPAIFQASGILLLPSRFDTFSCVVLEALSCGLPVVAYNTKGPRDIVEDDVNGYLVETDGEMAGRVAGFFLDRGKQPEMKQAAIRRAEAYRADRIMDRLLQDTGLVSEPCTL